MTPVEPEAAHVIVPGQERLLTAALKPAGRAAREWSLQGVDIERSQVRSRYRRTDDGRRLDVLLIHPSQETEQPHARTSIFVVVPSDDMDPGEVSHLIASIVTGLRRIESRWRWMEESGQRDDPVGDPSGEDEGDETAQGAWDTEFVALQAGVKPCVRSTAGAAELDEVRSRYEDLGLHVRRRERWDDHGGVRSDVLCISQSADLAEQLCALERELHDRYLQAQPGLEAAEAALAERIGELLGYPRCCIAAHADRLRLPIDVTPAFDAARSAWTECPNARLNDLLVGETTGFITFEPCRYDCSAATSYANAVASGFARAYPGRLGELDARLAVDVAVARSGARARVEVSGAGSELELTRVEPVARVRGEPVGPEARRELEQLVGLRVDAGGLVERDSVPLAVLLRFGTPG